MRGAYGISWAYLVGDVSHEGYKAYLRQQRIAHPGMPGVVSHTATDATTSGAGAHVAGDLKPGKVPAIEDYRTVMVQRAIFQSVASMGLPAFTIHSIVRYSGQALKKSKNMRIRSYGPIGVRFNLIMPSRACQLTFYRLIAGSCCGTVLTIYV